MKNKTPLRRAHHEGSVRQRPDGRWEVRFTIPASDGEKARRKSYYCHTKQEAVQILRGQWDPQWNLGPNGTTLLTVGEWLEIWLEHKELSLKPSTLRHYKSVIRCHLKPLFRRRIYQLSLTYIEAFSVKKNTTFSVSSYKSSNCRYILIFQGLSAFRISQSYRRTRVKPCISSLSFVVHFVVNHAIILLISRFAPISDE